MKITKGRTQIQKYKLQPSDLTIEEAIFINQCNLSPRGFDLQEYDKHEAFNKDFQSDIKDNANAVPMMEELKSFTSWLEIKLKNNYDAKAKQEKVNKSKDSVKLVKLIPIDPLFKRFTRSTGK